MTIDKIRGKLMQYIEKLNGKLYCKSEKIIKGINDVLTKKSVHAIMILQVRKCEFSLYI